VLMDNKQSNEDKQVNRAPQSEYAQDLMQELNHKYYHDLKLKFTTMRYSLMKVQQTKPLKTVQKQMNEMDKDHLQAQLLLKEAELRQKKREELKMHSKQTNAQGALKGPKKLGDKRAPSISKSKSKMSSNSQAFHGNDSVNTSTSITKLPEARLNASISMQSLQEGPSNQHSVTFQS